MRWRFFVLVAFLCLAACGDDDSDFATRPDGKESSSSGASSSSISPKSSDSKTKNDGSEYDADANTLTDFRDGKTYKTVVVGSQTWMAENLNFEATKSFCYGGAASNCAKYGRLYTWATAMDSVGEWSTNGEGCGYRTECSPTYPVRGVCPKGWHLPDTTEWQSLFSAVGGKTAACKMLKSTSGWNSNGEGLDAFGFSALPAGYRDYRGGWHYEGTKAYFCSSTEGGIEGASRLILLYDDEEAYLGIDYKYFAYSVRCLKD